jgi:SAM-dependent methyltransferase
MTGAHDYDGRGASYEKYFSAYPRELVEAVVTKLGAPGKTTIAEVGSGTGTFTRELVERGFRVLAIEPSQDMRSVAESVLRGAPNFVSVAGSGNATTLAAASADVVFAAQNIHWYYGPETSAEFRRVLRPGGRVFVLEADSNPHTGGTIVPIYRRLLAAVGDLATFDRFAPTLEAALVGIFGPDGCSRQSFVQPLRYTFDEAYGMLTSIALFPRDAGDARDAVRGALEEVFRDHAKDGVLEATNKLDLFWGAMAHDGP